ncbi:DUF1853 family protein [Gelidibacter salicanalis]|uniref:DUF1853 family protein n=1 Tax=Gelidibacter salicanalis TaxID=291193 RepID=A0A5C7ABT8_9FLAO|nr:DUF1853 family protein [Gelidibacter salicanalis]TXE06038.1 DUF1853 family protein [Gelidibacter salicanalis]
MDTASLLRNFKGYVNTSQLLGEAPIYGLKSFVMGVHSGENFIGLPNKKLRLGKLVEQFVFHELASDAFCSILSENIQIQDGKITIGELDALLVTDTGAVHLEIIYKFYLYDPDSGVTELSHWIGPNRNDALVQKLTKLKEKQLPLLYHKKTQPLLEKLGLQASDIQQQVLFKAQLFLPLNFSDDAFDQLNPDCVKGFYIHSADMAQFKADHFFIPQKMDWIMDPHDAVCWLNYDEFKIEVTVWLKDQRSPLCWLRTGTTLKKFFVVWW